MFARVKYLTFSVIGIMLIGVTACRNNAESLTESEKQYYLATGDSIATHAQKVLLANVGQAIQNAGVAGAVDFCNVHAMPLTDSVSSIYGITIQRVSDRNRNPDNALQSETDKEAWQQMMLMMKDTAMKQKQLVLQQDGSVYYYKAIPLGMPTCLSCHGMKDENILPETQQVLSAKYPNDKATGYSIGELRGLWKIKMNPKAQ
ncbi:MAG: DUF3365 domain-containing protein [Bacteroidetes bacterium]|nr:DUF3365 domain-containing protein [Bacteroidota bacterium]